MRAHAELTWILNCTATFGELRRMTQFKEKSEGQESVSVGLFDYPVLMAADILLYDTDEVPVGDDQRQHVELTRDIAIRFNHRSATRSWCRRRPSRRSARGSWTCSSPTKKMSKSDESPQGTILVAGRRPRRSRRRSSPRSPTPDTEVRHDREQKPGISNLIEIYGAVTGASIAAVEKEFAGQQYGAFKTAVADAVVEFVRPVQERYAALDADPAEVDRRLALGAEAAEAKAERVLGRAMKAAGLPRPAADASASRRLRAVGASLLGFFQGSGFVRSAGHASLPCTSP